MKLKNKVSNVSGVLSKTKLVNIQSNRFINHFTHLTHNTHDTHSKRAAFTLAETLITLGIIGVVAAITMPVLIQNYKKHAALNKIKTTFTTLNNALERAKADYGLDVNEWNIPPKSEDSSAADYFAEHYLIPYLKVVKDCKYDKSAPMCSLKLKPINSSTISTVNPDTDIARIFALSNGVILRVIITSSVYSSNRVQIQFFINGIRDANIYGRDLFAIELGGGSGSGTDKNKFYPYAYSSANLPCDKYASESVSGSKCTNEGNGYDCLAYIYCNNWEIPDDYPVRF